MRTAVVACLMSTVLLPAAAEDAPATYLVEAIVVQIPKGTELEVRTSAQEAFAPLSPDRALPLAEKAISLRAKDGRTIEATEAAFSLSRKDFPDLLACPSILVEAGKTASIFVGGKVEYLEPEKLPSGELRFRTKEEGPSGARLAVVIRPDEGGKTLGCDLDLSVTTVTGREPVPGSALPVGKPTLETTALKCALHFPPSTPALIPSPVKGGGWILLFLRISPPKSPAWRTLIRDAPPSSRLYVKEQREGEPEKKSLVIEAPLDLKEEPSIKLEKEKKGR